MNRILVDACDANTRLTVEDRGPRKGRVVVVSECSGDSWYDRASYRVPISPTKAQQLIDTNARFVAGPTQQKFLDAATDANWGK